MTTPFGRDRLAASWRAWASYVEPAPGPWWLQWIWTLLLAVLLALIFTVLGVAASAGRGGPWLDPGRWALWLGQNFVVSLTVGAIIHGLLDALAPWARPRVAGWNMAQRALFFCGVPLAGLAVGWPLGLSLAGIDVVRWFARAGASGLIASSTLIALVITFMMYQFFSVKARQFLAEKRAAEAQLRLLQAQIEPHFLFNTLANVQALIEHDPGKSKAMLGAFTDYLRASLTGLRRDEVTLADELALAEAYLRVQATRMEERLHYRIEAGEAARRSTLLPLLLQPLVENAVMHGLEPKVEGGSIEVRARVEGGSVVVEVRDDGRGLGAAATPPVHPARGAGMALANVRERLAARFGPAASLTVIAAEPGTLATLRLPWAPEGAR